MKKITELLMYIFAIIIWGIFYMPFYPIYWYTHKELRLPYKNGYLIWNKGLQVGEGTTNADLWQAGYGFGVKYVLGIKFIEARL